MINVVDVTKDYRTEGRVHRVLSGISFTVAKGEKLALLGRNGAGKSTLIRLIGGVELPTRGTIEQTDWHDQAERAFLLQLIKHLDAAIAAGKAKSMIMVAPPRALGMLRPAYSHALQNAVRVELDKDLVKHPVDRIEKQLTGA